jgi:peroxiredoxin
MITKLLIGGLFAVAMTGALGAVEPTKPAAPVEKVAPGETPAAPAPAAPLVKAPDFSLMDQSGKTIKLADFSGKIVVLEWLNTECPFTLRHYRAKTMVTLADTFRDKGVMWLAINSTSTGTADINRKWHETYKLPYPILDDHTGLVAKLYGAKTTPHIFIINMAGNIIYSGAIDNNPKGDIGDKAVNYVRVVLDDILAGRTPTYSHTIPYGCAVKYSN